MEASMIEPPSSGEFLNDSRNHANKHRKGENNEDARIQGIRYNRRVSRSCLHIRCNNAERPRFESTGKNGTPGTGLFEM
jgi:hypothetical protein